MITLNTSDFGLATHRVKLFDALVPGSLSKDDLEKPELWHNVARNLSAGDTDIRIMADDGSFYAYGVVTFARGSDVLVKIVQFVELDNVKVINDPLSAYKIKMKGPRKWCVVKEDKTNGDEIIHEGIAKQSDAQKALEDYLTALRQ